jgi:hypothetical protein
MTSNSKTATENMYFSDKFTEILRLQSVHGFGRMVNKRDSKMAARGRKQKATLLQ